ncbi:MAG: hypothetical protein LKJ90_00035 [Faecalibacterium sp.]|jgi:hypothetical protein|nr:hypothetical protein [Faecalibacterium sp.]
MRACDFSHGAKDLVAVCIDQAAGSSFAGRLYHQYTRQPLHFAETDQLLMQMDDLFDWLNYPQRTMQERTFRKKSKEPEKDKGETSMAKKEPEIVNEPAEQKGDIATFVIHVMYRQNATWQGSVLWAESGQTQNFRSALELIRLMDSAIEEDTASSAKQPAQENG